MTIRELKKDAKLAFKGKTKEILKTALFFCLMLMIINSSYSIIINKLAVNPLIGIFNIDLYEYFFDSTNEFVFSIIIYIISFVIGFIINGLLCYGMIACIMDIKRGHSTGFNTVFKKISSKIKKVLPTIGRYILKEIIYTLIYTIVTVISLLILYFLNTTVLDDLDGMLRSIAIITLLALSVIYIYKSVSLLLEMILSDFLINDYQGIKLKLILSKSKKIISKNKYKCLSLVLCTLWFLPAFIIEIILLSNAIDYYIWLPNVSEYTGTINSVLSTAPVWFLILKSMIITLIEVPIIIKIFKILGSFYTSFETEKLFDDDYAIQKEKRRYFLIALGLITLYVIVGIATYFVWNEFTTGTIVKKATKELIESRQNNISYWYENSNSAITSNTSIENADVENIKVEFVGYTEDNKFVIKVRNEDEKTAYISHIKTSYKDESGDIIKTVDAEEGYLVIDPNKEIYVYNDEMIMDYKDYSFSINLMNEYDISENFSDTKTFDFIMANNKNNISLEIKNNSKNDINLYSITMIYYKNGKIVGIDNYSHFNNNTIYSGKSDFINLELPKKVDEYIDFDRCDIQLDRYQKEEYTLKKAINSLKLEETFLANNGDLILKVKNESDSIICIDEIETIFRDDSGKYIEKQLCYESIFIMKPQSEMYLHNVKNEINNIDYAKYSNIDISANLYFSYLEAVNDYNIDILTTENSENIKVHLKNNGKKDLNNVYIRCIFFKNEKPIAFVCGSKVLKFFAVGKTINIDIDYPRGKDNEKLDYDKYEVEILNVS